MPFNYAEAVAYLFQLQSFGSQLGLGRMLRLAALAGNPHEGLRFIHVAGTNGKGSTCAMLESIYRAAGYRTGLYTSPHLVSFAERIQVNRQLIPEADVARLVNQLRPHAESFSPENHLTFFELVTALALGWFAEQRCDVVIWETGLGGRLDATNIVTPLASVITNIQFDHERWLGSTLREIAGEKAGIIKPGRPVITGVEDEGAWQVIEEAARARNCPVHRVGGHGAPDATDGALPLAGRHQLQNARVAAATVRTVQPTLPVSETALTAGLRGVQWAGRFQIMDRAGGGQLVLDGAHNVDGVRALCATLRERFPGAKPDIILGVFRDKNFTEMCRELAGVAGRIFPIAVQSERSASPEELAAAFASSSPALPALVCRSFEEALGKTRAGGLVVVTGSLNFIGEAMEKLRLSPASGQERLLNDWTPR